MLSEQEELVDLPIEQDSELYGLASLAESITSDDEIEAGEEFRRVLEENGMRAEGSRGLLDQTMRLLRRFRSRKLIADLGTHEVKLDWLGFHVPQRRKGQLLLGQLRRGGRNTQVELHGLWRRLAPACQGVGEP